MTLPSCTMYICMTLLLGMSCWRRSYTHRVISFDVFTTNDVDCRVKEEKDRSFKQTKKRLLNRFHYTTFSHCRRQDTLTFINIYSWASASYAPFLLSLRPMYQSFSARILQVSERMFTNFKWLFDTHMSSIVYILI